MRFASLGLVDGFTADLIVSGINHGSNLGDDITYSGTVAAALEGVILGIPGIAVSQQSNAREMDFRLGDRFDFDAAAAFTARLVEEIDDVPLPEGTLLNINVPAGEIDGVEVARLGKRIYRDQLSLIDEESGRKQYRIYGDAPEHDDEAGTDLVRDRRRAASRSRRCTSTSPTGPASRRCRPTTSRGCWRPPRAKWNERSVEDRADELKRQLAYHNHRYYVLDDPEIGDDAYDALLDELRAIEREHPELVTPDSPTQRVGAEPVSQLEKVTPPAADVLARQRALGGGAAGVGGAHARAPRARGDRGPAVRVRRRAEDRRARDLARLPRRRARARRHARQRRGRGGRHPQPAHDPRDPAAGSTTRRR